MATKRDSTRIMVVCDAQGHVAGALFPPVGRGKGSRGEPQFALRPRDGQRVTWIEVPNAIARLSGPDLQQYFERVRVQPDGRADLPRVRMRKQRDRGE